MTVEGSREVQASQTDWHRFVWYPMISAPIPPPGGGRCEQSETGRLMIGLFLFLLLFLFANHCMPSHIIYVLHLLFLCWLNSRRRHFWREDWFAWYSTIIGEESHRPTKHIGPTWLNVIEDAVDNYSRRVQAIRDSISSLNIVVVNLFIFEWKWYYFSTNCRWYSWRIGW